MQRPRFDPSGSSDAALASLPSPAPVTLFQIGKNEILTSLLTVMC